MRASRIRAILHPLRVVRMVCLISLVVGLIFILRVPLLLSWGMFLLLTSFEIYGLVIVLKYVECLTIHNKGNSSYER